MVVPGNTEGTGVIEGQFTRFPEETIYFVVIYLASLAISSKHTGETRRSPVIDGVFSYLSFLAPRFFSPSSCKVGREDFDRRYRGDAT